MSIQDILGFLRVARPHLSSSDLDRYAIEVHAHLTKVPDCPLNVDTLCYILHTHTTEPQQACDVDLTKGDSDHGKCSIPQINPKDETLRDAELVKLEADLSRVHVQIKERDAAWKLEWQMMRHTEQFEAVRKGLLRKRDAQDEAACVELRAAVSAINKRKDFLENR